MAKEAVKSAPRGRGLGKGLSALMSESYSQIAVEEAEQGTESSASNESADATGKKTLPLAVLHPGKFQPRRHFEPAALSELTESIRKNGVMQPILVRPVSGGKYEIIAGERRWRASQMAGLDSIPVLIRELSDEIALELALVENIQRKDLSPLEEAAGYQRLMDEFGYTQEMLATTVHKSRSHIANLLRLLSLPDEVRQLLEEDQITMGHARALMNTANPGQLAQEVLRKGLNVRQTEKLANADKGRPPVAPRAKNIAKAESSSNTQPLQVDSSRANVAKDPDIIALEATLSENLGLRVSIEDRGQSGEITISYESLEQLDEILRRLGGSV